MLSLPNSNLTLFNYILDLYFVSVAQCTPSIYPIFVGGDHVNHGAFRLDYNFQHLVLLKACFSHVPSLLTLLLTSLSLGRISRVKPSAWPLVRFPPFMKLPKARTRPRICFTVSLSCNTCREDNSSIDIKTMTMRI